MWLQDPNIPFGSKKTLGKSDLPNSELCKLREPPKAIKLRKRPKFKTSMISQIFRQGQEENPG